MTIPLDPVAGPSFAELLDRHTGPALALARRIVGDDALAEDVVQEAFLAYWRNPAAYDPARGPFRSWLLATVHHKAVDAVRREEAQRRRLSSAAAEAAVGPWAEPDTADVAAGLAGSDLRVALAGLPAAQREALVLAYWGGFTQREIAERTGTPLGTVKTRMLAGTRRLQVLLPQPALR